MSAKLSLLHALRRRYRADDEGSLLVVAILVGFIGLSLGLLVTAQAIVTSGDSGRDRQRTGQVHAAEAGVDAAYYQLQLGTTPCALPVANLAGSPDVTQVNTSINYFNGNVALTCSSNVLSGTPTKAVITSVATSTNRVSSTGLPSVRTMESEVLLSPVTGGKGYAIYSATNFTVPNLFTLTGNGVDPPDIYARQGFMCVNNSTLAGSVFSASGSVSLANSCLIQGSLTAYGRIDMANSARVARNVSSSTNGLYMQNSSSIGGSATVSGVISGGAGRITGTQTAGVTTIPNPPDQPLPWIGYDPAAWQSAGYTIEDRGSDCATVKTRMFLVTTPTVFYADCVLSFSGNNNGKKLKTDVALFLPQGMNVVNNFGVSSDTSAVRKLFIISPPKHKTALKPVGWTAADCDGGDLFFANQTDFAPTVNVFMYSCKKVTVANNSTFTGQVYGQTVSVANNFNMAFVGLPPVGIDLSGATTLQGYRVEVVYKRET